MIYEYQLDSHFFTQWYNYMEKYTIHWYELCIFGKSDGDAKEISHSSHKQYISVLQKHTDTMYTIDWSESNWQQVDITADAIIAKTSHKKWIWVYMADCNNIALLWTHWFWVVHGSWKTLSKWLLEKTIQALANKWEKYEDIHVFVWPAITWVRYEVWPEFYDIFNEKYLTKRDTSLYFDMTHLINDIVLDIWCLPEYITIHQDCTYQQNNRWRSYRKWDIWPRNFLWIKPL